MSGLGPVRLLGRRQALKYFAIGMAATVVSACSGSGSGGGPKAQALKAFVTGSWRVERQGESFTVEVHKDGTWTTGSDETDTAPWEYREDRILIGDPTGAEEDAVLHDVPGTVDGSFSSKHQWDGGFFSTGPETMKISYDGTTLTLGMGGSVATCTKL